MNQHRTHCNCNDFVKTCVMCMIFVPGVNYNRFFEILAEGTIITEGKLG